MNAKQNMSEEAVDVMSPCKISAKRKKDSSVNKSKKKKNRLFYENIYKDQMLGELLNDKDEEELNLERFVFGGEEDVLEELNAEQPKKLGSKKLKKSKVLETKNLVEDHSDENLSGDELLSGGDRLKKPCWKDAEESTTTVGEKANTLINCHRSVSQRGDEKYKDYAKEKFLKITGTPQWADLGKKGGTADSDEESEEELLQKTGNFILRSASLQKGKIDIRHCPNLADENSKGSIIKSVEFHPTSKVALVAGLNGTTTLYQVDGKINSKIQSVHFEKFPIYTAHFTVDGNEVVVGSKDFGHFFTYDMIAGKIIKVPWERGMEQMNVRRFHMSPDGKYIVVHGRYGNIHLLSAQTKEWIGTLKMNGEVIAVTFNRDGSRMYSHGDTGQIYVWDLSNRVCIHKFYDEGCITGTSLAFSPNNQFLAAGSDTGVVNIYENLNLLSTTNPRPAKVLMNLTTEVNNMKFNSTSEILAISSSFKTDALKLVQLPSMTVFSNFPTQEKKFKYVNSLDISLNSGYLLFGNNTGSTYMYRLRHYANY